MDNYRPISLTTCVSKLLEMLVLDELKANFTPHDLQLGFTRQRGTGEASILAIETIQWNRRRDLPVYAANLDARKCFDKIWHDGLFTCLDPYLSRPTWCLVAQVQAPSGFVGAPGRVPSCRRSSPTPTCTRSWRPWMRVASVQTSTDTTRQPYATLTTYFCSPLTLCTLVPCLK